MTLPTRTTLWFTATLVACAAVVPLAGSAADSQTANESLKVTVKYTGKGDVDTSHRLSVWLFDSPDIGPGAIPVAELSLEENGSGATFRGLSAQKLWIAVAYDEKGGFSGSAPPPSGSPPGHSVRRGVRCASTGNTRRRRGSLHHVRRFAAHSLSHALTDRARRSPAP